MRGGLLAAGVGLFLAASVLVYRFPVSHAHRVPYPPLLSYLGLGLALVAVVLFIAGLAMSSKNSESDDDETGANPLAVPDYITHPESSASGSPQVQAAPESAPTTPVPLPEPVPAPEPAPVPSVQPPLGADQLSLSALPAIVAAPTVTEESVAHHSDSPEPSDDGGFCPFCGVRAQPDFKYCRSCGKAIGDRPTPPLEPAESWAPGG